MLDIPSKKSEKTSFIAPLKKYIQTNYNEEPSKFDADLNALDDLRNRATNSPDVENCLKYFGQLQFLGAKFPINEKGVKISFSWTHAFNKKKFLSYNINFEKGSTLFNLGAAYSQRAKLQNLKNPDGVKQAYNLYQLAAGAFALLRENVPVWFAEVTSTDMTTSTLKSLELAMLAQAQEVFYNKAVADQKSPSILSKLAGQAADLFDQSYDAVHPDPQFNGFEGRLDWLVLIQARALYLNGLAHYHLAGPALQEMKYGEEIARLGIALSFFDKAVELAKTTPEFLPTVRDLIASVHSRLRAANKDNDTIYMEPVPPSKSLPPIGRHLMVKSSELTDLAKPAVVGAPLFQSLVPLHVHRAAAQYKQKKENFVAEHLVHIDKTNAALTNTLVSLNLPASIDAYEAPIGLPQGLLLRSQEVRSEGGAPSLAATTEHLALLSKKILDLFNEGMKLLDKEELEDNVLRGNYGSRWIRTPSATLNESLKQEAITHKQLLENAAKSDAIVKNKIESNFAAIEQLGASKQDLEQAIPSSGTQKGAGTNPHIATLRKLIEEVYELRKQNDLLAEQLKTLVYQDDIVPTLLETFGNQEIIDPEPAFQNQLKIYESVVAKIKENVLKQENLIRNLTDTNKQFSSSKATNEFISRRENALKQLDIGYNAFKEIKSNLKEGMKFYSQMESVATIFKGKCEDFVMARETEKNDLIKALSTQPKPPPTMQQAPQPTAQSPSENLYNYTDWNRSYPYNLPPSNQPNPAFAPSAPSATMQQSPYNPYYPFPKNPYH